MKNVSYINRPNRPLFVYAILFLIFLYLPILFLPLFSFNEAIYIAFPIQNWTLQWYRDMFNNQPMIAALINSMKVGLVA